MRLKDKMDSFALFVVLSLAGCGTNVYAPLIRKSFELCEPHGGLNHIHTMAGESIDAITAVCVDGMQMSWNKDDEINSSPVVERMP